MKRKHEALCRASVVLMGALAFLPQMSAQTSNVGAVTVTVFDPAGASVPAAELQLRDTETNDIRKAETQANGVYTFPNLQFGKYELSITKQGFESQIFSSVQVQTGRRGFEVSQVARPPQRPEPNMSLQSSSPVQVQVFALSSQLKPAAAPRPVLIRADDVVVV